MDTDYDEVIIELAENLLYAEAYINEMNATSNCIDLGNGKTALRYLVEDPEEYKEAWVVNILPRPDHLSGMLNCSAIPEQTLPIPLHIMLTQVTHTYNRDTHTYNREHVRARTELDNDHHVLKLTVTWRVIPRYCLHTATWYAYPIPTTKKET